MRQQPNLNRGRLELRQMRNYMFKSRWGALLFVCLIAFGAANLIGSSEEDGVLLQATAKIAKDQDEFGQLSDMPDSTGPAPDSAWGTEPDDTSVDGFADDADLINDARGFDPTPDLDPQQELEKINRDDGAVIVIDRGEAD